MATQFEFHLVGAEALEGELDADNLIAILTSLKEVATKIGRTETDAESLGRAPRRTQQVAKLTIGLTSGSTTLQVRRAGVSDALEFDSTEEEAWDQKFESIVESIAAEQRPGWVDDSLALAASHLGAALKHAAPHVEFTVGGQTRCAFETGKLRLEIWEQPTQQDPGEVTFTGRLFAVNLKTHRLQVRDDVGNEVALPRVRDDEQAGRLLNSYVTVVGLPTYGASGELTQLREAHVEAAAATPGTTVALPELNLDDLRSSPPGPVPSTGITLTEEESDAFFEALRLM
ncbi:MAG: hypothetical protein ACK5LO_16035 [Leucobacter sp.]